MTSQPNKRKATAKATGKTKQPRPTAKESTYIPSATSPHPNEFIGQYKKLIASPDEAMEMLKKIGALVKPIMKKYGWKVRKFSEFYPKNANLLGMNRNWGAVWESYRNSVFLITV